MVNVNGVQELALTAARSHGTAFAAGGDLNFVSVAVYETNSDR